MNSLQILFFADTHLGYDYPLKPRVQRRRRGPDFFKNFQFVLNDAIRRKVDLVIHGGDLFFRSKVPPKIVDMVYHALSEFADHGIPMYLVPGNHERSILPQSLFLNHSNIFIFDRPRTYILATSQQPISLAGFPNVRCDIRSQFKSILYELRHETDRNQFKLLCMHQAVEGSRVAHYTFRTGHDVIKMSDIPIEYAAILSGHIHRRQVLYKSSSGHPQRIPIIYPGSTERTSFAERDESKGFYIIELTSDQQRSWIISKIDFQELTTRPMIDIILPNTIEANKLRLFFENEIEKLPPDAIVRLRTKVRPNDQILQKLSASFLRDVFPDSMNVQLSNDVVRWYGNE